MVLSGQDLRIPKYIDELWAEFIAILLPPLMKNNSHLTSVLCKEEENLEYCMKQTEQYILGLFRKSTLANALANSVQLK